MEPHRRPVHRQRVFDDVQVGRELREEQRLLAAGLELVEQLQHPLDLGRLEEFVGRDEHVADGGVRHDQLVDLEVAVALEVVLYRRQRLGHVVLVATNQMLGQAPDLVGRVVSLQQQGMVAHPPQPRQQAAHELEPGCVLLGRLGVGQQLFEHPALLAHFLLSTVLLAVGVALLLLAAVLVLVFAPQPRERLEVLGERRAGRVELLPVQGQLQPLHLTPLHYLYLGRQVTSHLSLESPEDEWRQDLLQKPDLRLHFAAAAALAHCCRCRS
mmetsp:Transcript_18391/g.52528  ORF Transcript_18391/g.52528 Transcript_18391/m.52528 type:complete len:270 (-) Transcript_18391:592-1401(-)